MLVVELIGLPGSGKTTIVRETHARLLEEGNGAWLGYEDVMPLARGAPLARLAHGIALAKALVTDPGSRQVLASVMRGGTKRQRRRALKHVDLTVRLGRHRHRGSAVLLDQGPMQALASVLTEGPLTVAPPDLDAFGAAVEAGAPDVLCYVELNPQVAADRLLGRPAEGTYFDGMDRAELVERYRHAVPVYAALMKRLGSLPECTVIRLLGDRSVAANAGRVAEIARHLQRSRMCASA